MELLKGKCSVCLKVPRKASPGKNALVLQEFTFKPKLKELLKLGSKLTAWRCGVHTKMNMVLVEPLVLHSLKKLEKQSVKAPLKKAVKKTKSFFSKKSSEESL